MERGSDKHGRRLDEAIKHETEGIVRGGGTSRAEEWMEPEPVQDPEADLSPREYAPGHEPGVAPGMSAADVERRSNLAKWLSDAAYPADPAALLRHVERNPAVPDAVVAAVRSLPDAREFRNIGDIAEALGLGRERRHAE
ncbi:DUF2795 domain-containing protein [Sphaerisporangium sp. TRM90804]|uniref:DUF2795 domain-containing protein n=1 Tax=Sphaerisporangium sp. TRM90804 TaxID=3031113 RepID=UPI002446C3B6|nr:DUF2795 domain-containing protein [Sphaerisporangium sp. TRM90804]MDH2429633.1 DUF2795 domain-containing protein [Sphaerisporangium sp. TRM90804]